MWGQLAMIKKPHRIGALTQTQIDAIVDHKIRGQGLGVITWRQNGMDGVFEGNLKATVTLTTAEDARIKIGVNIYKPYRAQLAYILRDVAVIRVCVNAKHNGWNIATHMHQYTPNGAENCNLAPQFFPLPIQDTVPPGTWGKIFESFCHLTNIGLPLGYWREPPGG